MSAQSDYSVNLARLLRKQLGMSQAELAARAELSPHVVANLESRRKVDMTLDELVLIADALGVSPQCLLGDPTKKDRQWLGEHAWNFLATAMAKP